MDASTPTQNAPASQPLNQDPEAQLEKPAETGESESPEPTGSDAPFIFKLIAGFILVGVLLLPVIFLTGVIFTLTGVMRSDGSIVLDEEEDRPIVKAFAGLWLAVWLGADLFAKVLLLGFLMAAFVVYFFG